MTTLTSLSKVVVHPLGRTIISPGHNIPRRAFGCQRSLSDPMKESPVREYETVCQPKGPEGPPAVHRPLVDGG